MQPSLDDRCELLQAELALPLSTVRVGVERLRESQLDSPARRRRRRGAGRSRAHVDGGRRARLRAAPAVPARADRAGHPHPAGPRPGQPRGAARAASGCSSKGPWTATGTPGPAGAPYTSWSRFALAPDRYGHRGRDARPSGASVLLSVHLTGVRLRLAGGAAAGARARVGAQPAPPVAGVPAGRVGWRPRRAGRGPRRLGLPDGGLARLAPGGSMTMSSAAQPQPSQRRVRALVHLLRTPLTAARLRLRLTVQDSRSRTGPDRRRGGPGRAGRRGRPAAAAGGGDGTAPAARAGQPGGHRGRGGAGRGRQRARCARRPPCPGAGIASRSPASSATCCRWRRPAPAASWRSPWPRHRAVPR